MKPTPRTKRQRAEMAAVFTLAAGYIVTREHYYACTAIDSASPEDWGINVQMRDAFLRYFKPAKASASGAWWPDLLRFHYDIRPRPRCYYKAQNARAFGLLLMAELARRGDLDHDK